MITELPGITNGHSVDGTLYRGGDVTLEGVEMLAKMGIRLVICLKNADDDNGLEIRDEHGWVMDAGMEFSFSPLNNSGKFSYKDIKLVPAILTLIKNTEGKVFVHCHHGSDRTGVVVACYRIQEYRWDADRALKEMKKYGNAWYNHGMRSAVKDFKPRELNK